LKSMLMIPLLSESTFRFFLDAATSLESATSAFELTASK
jgi:hypothetical protein